MIGAVLEDFLTEEEKAALEKPTPSEEELLAKLSDKMEAVTDALAAADTKAYSLDELSSLVPATSGFPSRSVVFTIPVVEWVGGSPPSGGGKSELLRAAGWITSRRGNTTESATERYRRVGEG